MVTDIDMSISVVYIYVIVVVFVGNFIKYQKDQNTVISNDVKDNILGAPLSEKKY